jgi:hypothetical protein
LRLAALSLALLPARAAADDPDRVAQEFLKRAAAAERRLRNEDEARAWYRAASACYRYYVLPIRLAQLDYLRGTGLLLPSDLEADGGGGPEAPDAAAAKPVASAYVEDREEVVRRYEERATRALHRALAIESDMPVRSAGYVPYDALAIRSQLETLLEAATEAGPYELVLAHGHLDIGAPDGGADAASVEKRWLEEKNFASLAEAAEFAVRLIRESALAYYQASLQALAKSTKREALEDYRGRIEALERRAALKEADAVRYYRAAAAAEDSEGSAVRAMVFEERARRIQEASARKEP